MKRKSFEKIAIANRGEVAVRIIRACQELGIRTVLLHSEPDVQTLAYRLSDEQVCIGPAPTGDSYLNIEANVHGALSVGAEAIHPGFGFLSENAAFAESCEQANLVFVGPSAEAIRLFGDKISAKQIAEMTKTPVVPGYEGTRQDLEFLVEKASRIGFPVIAKAAGGGGGRGLRVLRSKVEAAEGIKAAQREGESSFGSSRVFLEKYLERAKHIEVQIFGDASGHVHTLGERECSVQRRHQKIIEEALSSVDGEMREQLKAAAARIATKARYIGAGTVEFLVDDNNFYFMEMNTRLQVEHPVTELVFGVDLVKAQILTAAGETPRWPNQWAPRGHAIECRIYAEDPYRAGIPSTGRLGNCHFPIGPGRRFEVGFEAGDEITSYYDSMIAKVIVWDETRLRAIQKMMATLRETVIFGVKTNIPFLLAILQHPEFIQATMTTRFIENHFARGLESVPLTDSERKIAEVLYQQIGERSEGELKNTDLMSPWGYSWRLGNME